MVALFDTVALRCQGETNLKKKNKQMAKTLLTYLKNTTDKISEILRGYHIDILFNRNKKLNTILLSTETKIFLENQRFTSVACITMVKRIEEFR